MTTIEATTALATKARAMHVPFASAFNRRSLTEAVADLTDNPGLQWRDIYTAVHGDAQKTGGIALMNRIGGLR